MVMTYIKAVAGKINCTAVKGMIVLKGGQERINAMTKLMVGRQK
jgi:hypothetical protein